MWMTIALYLLGTLVLADFIYEDEELETIDWIITSLIWPVTALNILYHHIRASLFPNNNDPDN